MRKRTCDLKKLLLKWAFNGLGGEGGQMEAGKLVGGWGGWGTVLRVHRIGWGLDRVEVGQWNGGEGTCGDPSEETLGC